MKLEGPFRAVQEPYIYHSQEDKWQFFDDNPHEGFKFHLNCDPVDAGAISRFLRAQEINHKYLNGGDVESGKIYTVYSCSKEQTENKIPMIRHHHEHFDGRGYPDGLKGEEIPMAARIIAIPDAFDAMTSMRPHREAMSLEEVLVEMEQCKRKQFDPGILEIFLREKAYRI